MSLELKCPICTKKIEIQSKLPAHDKVQVEAYCCECDVLIDVIMRREPNG